jgi:hypothetical protein
VDDRTIVGESERWSTVGVLERGFSHTENPPLLKYGYKRGPLFPWLLQPLINYLA